MIAIPGDTPASTISAIIADEMAIGVINQKTTAVRIIPAAGKTAVVMPVHNYSSEVFINRGGRIPAPIHSLKN